MTTFETNRLLGSDDVQLDRFVHILDALGRKLGLADKADFPVTADDAKNALQAALGAAVLVEFSTIPPYLTAMYSIIDKSSNAYHLIRSVVIEEMLHVNLASNLLVALGGRTKLSTSNPSGPPHRYPGPVPGMEFGPYLQLMPVSQAQIKQLFLAIERPAPAGVTTVPTGPTVTGPKLEFSTIGQFYLAIQRVLEVCEKKRFDLFNPASVQRTDFYYGNGGGRPVAVSDYKTSYEAIKQIVQQGEGADTLAEFGYLQPWGAYTYYGHRSDGTYGPILGTPLEMSHYYKFKLISDGVVPLPDTYPMAANPSVEMFEGGSLPSGGEPKSLAGRLGMLFNDCYTFMVDNLEKALSPEPASDEDPSVTDLYFARVVPMMQAVLPTLATQLMQIPLDPKGDPLVGPNAGPPFQYAAGSAQSPNSILTKAEHLQCAIVDGAYYKVAPPSLPASLDKVVRTLRDLASGDPRNRTF